MPNDAHTSKAVEILLIEDNPADVEITQHGFKVGKIANNLHVVMDGEEALTFLRNEEPYTDAPRPDLILLDLNLPGLDGRDILAEIKDDASLKTIPVVILTSSDANTDVLETYELHANAYMQKPVEFAKFVEVVQSISAYWFSVVRLPEPDATE